MTGVTSLPAALRGCRMIPLKTGSKTPNVKSATFDAAARWDEGTERFLASGGRVGVFMGGSLVGLDIDLKIAYQDDGLGSSETSMVMVSGRHDLDRLLALAGLSDLPRTLQVRTPSGGTHYYLRQNPAFPAAQCTIGCLDIRAARNAYLAIGQGYEVVDDGGGQLAEIPEALARAIMSVPHSRDSRADGQLLRDGTYGNYDTAFNNALTALKGSMIGMGWPEADANAAIRAVNATSRDPIPDEKLEETVLREKKGWIAGQALTQSELDWARSQTGITEGDPEDAYLDVQTVKRLWTTERFRQYQEMQALELPELEQLAAVIAEPPPDWVIEGLMTAGLYGLAGPQEAGKSLLVKEWCRAVSNGENWRGYRAQRRQVTYVISEGHFDLAERFSGFSIEGIRICRKPVLLSNETAVDYFLTQHEGLGTGLVVFDIIYHMGVSDDNTMKDVKPVLQACRKIAYALNCAVVVVGHPGHNTGRRFRGTSIWRNWFDGEFHMADGRITCEKHKYARREEMEWYYDVDWPNLRYLTESELIGKAAIMNMIRDELEAGWSQPLSALARHVISETQTGTPYNTVKTWVSQVKKQLGN